jgi:hypothetical protein
VKQKSIAITQDTSLFYYLELEALFNLSFVCSPPLEHEIRYTVIEEGNGNTEENPQREKKNF